MIIANESNVKLANELNVKISESEYEGMSNTEIVTYCCDEMKKAIDDRTVFEDAPIYINGRSYGPPGEEYCDEIPIHYCPFCGATITYTDERKHPYRRLKNDP